MEGHNLRKECRCGCLVGRIETKNGQDCLFCIECGKFQYNAPKVETGRRSRSVSSVHNGVTAGKHSRVIMRATARCELCGSKGTTDNPLHVGHILSVKEGLARGLTEIELNDEENLACMCAECNLGIGKTPLPIRLLVSILMARITEVEQQ